MAAPTPVYPSWLTPVPITTEVDGVSVVETSIKYLPLTYFGPSVCYICLCILFLDSQVLSDTSWFRIYFRWIDLFFID